MATRAYPVLRRSTPRRALPRHRQFLSWDSTSRYSCRNSSHTKCFVCEAASIHWSYYQVRTLGRENNHGLRSCGEQKTLGKRYPAWAPPVQVVERKLWSFMGWVTFHSLVFHFSPGAWALWRAIMSVLHSLWFAYPTGEEKKNDGDAKKTLGKWSGR